MYHHRIQPVHTLLPILRLPLRVLGLLPEPKILFLRREVRREVEQFGERDVIVQLAEAVRERQHVRLRDLLETLEVNDENRRGRAY